MQRSIYRVTATVSRSSRSFHAAAGRASPLVAGSQRFAVSQLPSAPATVWSRQSVRFMSAELTKVLQRELEDEESNEAEDEELAEVTTNLKKIFTLEDQLGMGVVKLSRKFGSEAIEIEFDCQNADDASMDMSVDETEGEEHEEEEGENDYGINFEVTIKKDGTHLLVDCLASDTLEVRNVRVISPDHVGKDALTLYGGPKFYDLDEELQSSFYEYLAERKIDDDLSYFVLAYSREKEQKEYVNWL
ncbi:mitochondrial glycoprotein, partial [Ochromonadaceae sp. CCMP2298]